MPFVSIAAPLTSRANEKTRVPACNKQSIEVGQALSPANRCGRALACSHTGASQPRLERQPLSLCRCRLALRHFRRGGVRSMSQFSGLSRPAFWPRPCDRPTCPSATRTTCTDSIRVRPGCGRSCGRASRRARRALPLARPIPDTGSCRRTSTSLQLSDSSRAPFGIRRAPPPACSISASPCGSFEKIPGSP